jgi:hypothetical protein
MEVLFYLVISCLFKVLRNILGLYSYILWVFVLWVELILNLMIKWSKYSK